MEEVSMDRISQLPDEVIHTILSILPLEDAARTSILSKSWNKVCRSYNFLYYFHLDHNKFALQELMSVETGREPDIREIRNKFIEFVENTLLDLSQPRSPKLELVLDVAVIDDEYNRVTQLMELVMRTKVEDLRVYVQTNGSRWYDEISQEDTLYYDFPYAVLITSKWLQSLTVQGCKFATELSHDLFTFSSLRQLWLSQVMVLDESVLMDLAHCCPEIELIEFDSCTLWMQSLDLEIFPRLKKASIVDCQYGDIIVVNLENTKLESLFCNGVDCAFGDDIHCRDKIRELTMLDFDYCFNNFTAAFPLIENAKLIIHNVDKRVNRFTASSPSLKTLDLFMAPILEKLYLHCDNLGYFNFKGCGFDKVHTVCPNLKQFNYMAHEFSDKVFDLASSSIAVFPKVLYVYSVNLEYFNYEGCGFRSVYIDCSNLRQFSYWANKLPYVLDLNLSPDIGCINFGLICYDLDKSWFSHLRKFLEQIAEHEICLHLRIKSQMAKLVLGEFGEKLPVFEQKKVHLIMELQCNNMQNPAAFVDALVWSIHPTTLTIRGNCGSFVKALYEKLDSITENNTCCGHLRVCSTFWWHNLVKGCFKNEIEEMKKKLTSMVEMNESNAMEFCLTFPGNAICEST